MITFSICVSAGPQLHFHLWCLVSVPVVVTPNPELEGEENSRKRSTNLAKLTEGKATATASHQPGFQNTSFNDIPGFPDASVCKESACRVGDMETQVQSLGREDLLEEENSNHSITLTGNIPRTEEPGGLQSMEGAKELDTTEHLSTKAHSHTCLLDTDMGNQGFT